MLKQEMQQAAGEKEPQFMFKYHYMYNKNMDHNIDNGYSMHTQLKGTTVMTVCDCEPNI